MASIDEAIGVHGLFSILGVNIIFRCSNNRNDLPDTYYWQGMSSTFNLSHFRQFLAKMVSSKVILKPKAFNISNCGLMSQRRLERGQKDYADAN